MEGQALETLRFPIGRFVPPEVSSTAWQADCIATIAAFPARLRTLVQSLTEEQLDTPYRPEGWTVRQVVHHVADSHLNSYIRFKWTLTEDQPMIKAYDQAVWAELPDGKNGPVEMSLDLLDAIHARWVYVLRKMTPAQFERKLDHPEWKRDLDLNFFLALYTWHCEHHYAHIAELAKREGW